MKLEASATPSTPGQLAVKRAQSSGRYARIALMGVFLLSLAACGDRNVTLFGGLSEAEANRLVAYLDGHGVATRKLAEREGTAVTVAASQLARASRLATQGGLPRVTYKGYGAVFPKDGLISSPLEERARLTYAVSQELEAMLVDIDGVLGARVNVVIPERRNGRNTDLPAAAVLIRHRSDLETDLLEMKVRRLVASSVPGLVEADARQISVSFMAVPGSGAASSTDGSRSSRLQDGSVHGLSASEATFGSSEAVAQRGAGGLSASPSVGDSPSTGASGDAATLIGMALGVVAAIAAIGWALRGQLAGIFQSKRRPAAPTA
ncbi:hypothetical protein BH09PSE5_BH09PSE5_16930 [soil metagenome]